MEDEDKLYETIYELVENAAINPAKAKNIVNIIGNNGDIEHVKDCGTGCNINLKRLSDKTIYDLYLLLSTQDEKKE